MERKIVCIFGPTGSGKTGLGVYLAKKFNGEIISADSRQVYRGLDLGTGKDLKEYGDVKHHLIDICDPGEKFNMFDWLKQAREAIKDIFKRGKLPVVVGGTGLYFKALVEGFEINQNLKIKNQNDNAKIKKYDREELENKSLYDLRKIFDKLPTTNYKLDLKNPRRVIRAIELAQEGIKPVRKKPDFESLNLTIDLDREELYKKIDRRVDSRFDEGMLEEIEGLIQSGVTTDWLMSLGLEYKIITNFVLNLKCKSQNAKLQLKIQNLKTFEEMKQELKFKSHAYARRQLTWLRKMQVQKIKTKKEAVVLVEKFLN